MKKLDMNDLLQLTVRQEVYYDTNQEHELLMSFLHTNGFDYTVLSKPESHKGEQFITEVVINNQYEFEKVRSFCEEENEKKLQFLKQAN